MSQQPRRLCISLHAEQAGHLARGSWQRGAAAAIQRHRWQRGSPGNLRARSDLPGLLDSGRLRDMQFHGPTRPASEDVSCPLGGSRLPCLGLKLASKMLSKPLEKAEVRQKDPSAERLGLSGPAFARQDFREMQRAFSGTANWSLGECCFRQVLRCWQRVSCLERSLWVLITIAGSGSRLRVSKEAREVRGQRPDFRRSVGLSLPGGSSTCADQHAATAAWRHQLPHRMAGWGVTSCGSLLARAPLAPCTAGRYG